MSASDTELGRFKATRDTAIHRLRLIEQGARIAYDDGTPVDMGSEKARLEEVVADMDRRIARLELAAATPMGPLN